jgi:hypothetical protein
MSLDVHNTKELLMVLNETAIFLIKTFKNGIQVKDDFDAIFAKLTEDQEFKALIMKAYEGIGTIPAEINDASFIEKIELATLEIKALRAIVNAIMTK